MIRKTITILAPLLALGLAGPAQAQTEIIPEGEFTSAGDDDIKGWNPSLAVNGSLNLVDNSNVVGQVEGLSMLLGFGVAGGADYVDGPSLLRLELTINEGFAKTPVIDRFIKTTDEVAIASTYNYFLTKTLGGFGRLKMTAPMFSARAITADPVDYTILSAEPGGADRTATSDQLKVASAFKPFTITESIGAFAAPIRKKAMNVNVRGGLGGRHTLASGVLVKNDDSLTPNVELQELTNVHQAGVELFAGLEGKAQKDRLTYSIGASVLIPFINNDDYDRSAFDLTRLGVEASATVSVFDWMGLVYKGSFIVDPQLFPSNEELTQFQNSLLLTFRYTLIDRKKGMKALKAESAVQAAEKKAKEAEERAKALEAELEAAKQREAEMATPDEATPETPTPDAATPETPTTAPPDGESPADPNPPSP